MAHDMYQAAMSSVPSSSRAYHHHHHQYPSLSLQPHHLPRLPTVTPVPSQHSLPRSSPDGGGQA
ncbi:hypothetical protein E2C01_051360 [Portunus trituberculatus]|uniref:Uncharacterized protein n=1 Tax=Portunus trituberculatus TaxID=210409 RepID=A0A5B7GBD7_PORTR|nr:hypothetical protein [Portunus trituberculatus]